MSALRLLAGQDPGDRAVMTLVGELTLGYETLALPSTPGLTMAAYLPEPSSPSADALDMLRGWIAEPRPTAPASPTADGT